MSKLQQVTGTDAGRQCVDLVRRFPWIDRSAAEPPEGVELLTVKFDDGDASKIECCIFDHDDPASDFKFTHWFPAPRQPECSNWIDDNESPYWPEPGERMGFPLITATLEEARGLLAKADLCECTAALHMPRRMERQHARVDILEQRRKIRSAFLVQARN